MCGVGPKQEFTYSSPADLNGVWTWGQTDFFSGLVYYLFAHAKPPLSWPLSRRRLYCQLACHFVSCFWLDSCADVHRSVACWFVCCCCSRVGVGLAAVDGVGAGCL